jgi:hypothetical protein
LISIIKDEFINVKDKRLEYLNIPKDLVESLNNAQFTIEIILNTHTSDIAQVLGIDDNVVQNIYHEAKYYYQLNYL